MDTIQRGYKPGKQLSRCVLLLCCSRLVFAEPADPRQLFPGTENNQNPSALWLKNQKPYPTNAWFINFVLNPDLRKPSDPVNIFPYQAQISLQGISLSYTNPIYYREPDHPDIISALYYQFEQQINLGAVEPMTSYGIDSYHGSRINLQWKNNNQQLMTSPIVQGSPYVSIIYSNTSPKLSSNFKLIAVNQQNTAGEITAATRFELVFATDLVNTQTWILYAENPLALSWENKDNQALLASKQAYTGWLRLILQKDSRTQLDNDPLLLDSFSRTIPLDYEQRYSSKEDSLSYSLSWQTQNGNPPLMLALPHQYDAAHSKVSQAKIKYSGIKGIMVGETKSSWEITLPKVAILYLEPKKYRAGQRQALRKALIADAQQLLSSPFPDDGPYQVGKRLGRATRITLIADQLGETGLRDKLLTLLKNVLSKKMQDKNGWHFEYDNTWGGIIPSIDDYGTRHYNDHHYHYGYWVYTIAVIGKFDPAWLTAPLQPGSFAPKEWTEMLIRDYANEDRSDPYFPAQRYQDDYVGHSWASGLTSFKDGQNEQSSSEAVNAYYAQALYAKTTNNPQLYQWAEFLMARELKAAQIYWQVQKDNPVYSPAFKANNTVVANLWDSKVDSNPFFVTCKAKYRCGLEYAYGIEMLPYTAITAPLLNKEWLQDSYPTLMKLINHEWGKITPAWQWILIKGLAPILSAAEKNYYFSKIVDSQPEAYDNGDSKTNSLYFLIND